LNWFQELIGSFASAASNQTFNSNTPAQVQEQLMRWLGHLSVNAVKRFAPNAIDPEPCEFCGQLSLGDCLVCGAKCCLAHAHVSHQAEMICHECVESQIGSREAEKQARRTERARQKAQRATKTPNADEQLVAALKTLECKRGAEWDDIHMSYKRLILKYHPDRAKSDSARAKAEEKLKSINAAYTLLKRYYEKAA
jgi:hypothetical protein